MSAHDHTTIVPGCYRCELGLDEMRAIELEELREVTAERDRYAEVLAEIRGRALRQDDAVLYRMASTALTRKDSQ